MTSQATNRKEGGSMSCCGRSGKLRYIYIYIIIYNIYIFKTVRVAQELLGALTIGGGNTQPGAGGGGSQRSQISLQNRRKYTKMAH
jgi:hypothetical protein